MGFILKKVRIENLKERTDVYSKLIRGNLNFILETHSLNNGHTLQVFLYRDHPRVKEFIEKAQEKNYITKTTEALHIDNPVLRLYINEESAMINSSGDVDIKITEYNFNNKELTLADFENAKVAVLIEFTMSGEHDHSKLKKELKNIIMEEINEDTNS